MPSSSSALFSAGATGVYSWVASSGMFYTFHRVSAKSSARYAQSTLAPRSIENCCCGCVKRTSKTKENWSGVTDDRCWFDIQYIRVCIYIYIREEPRKRHRATQTKRRRLSQPMCFRAKTQESRCTGKGKCRSCIGKGRDKTQINTKRHKSTRKNRHR